jgi:NTE family protein
MPDLTVSPATDIAPDRDGEAIRPGIAVCLSGGGYRAMLFHLGCLWRLAELRILSLDSHVGRDRAGHTTDLGSLQRVSSVSGGSIVSGQLALAWNDLARASPAEHVDLFRRRVVEPIRRFAGVDIAGKSLKGGLRLALAVILPGSINDHVARVYSRHLYGAATLRQIPATPRFIFNAANLQTSSLWRFSNPYAADWRVGKMLRTEKVTVARAVAASSAFPPFLAPATFRFAESDYEPDSGGKGTDNLHRPPFMTRPQLVDGGVYDNLGIETAYKCYRTVLVSNGGAPFDVEEKSPVNWVGLGARVISLIDNQVLSLRKRVLVGALARGERNGAFWDIEQDVSVHGCPDPLPCPHASTQRLASVGTDLASKEPRLQERLINWGYALADAALRAHVNPDWPRPAGFPYPDAGVG